MAPTVRLTVLATLAAATINCHHFTRSSRLCRSYRAEIRGYEVTFIEAVQGASKQFPRYAIFLKSADKIGDVPRVLGLDYDGDHAWDSLVFCGGYIANTIGCSAVTRYPTGIIEWETDPPNLDHPETLANFPLDRTIARMDLLTEEVKHATPMLSDQCFPMP